MIRQQDARHAPLVKLGDTQLRLLNSGDDLRNRKVIDADGEHLGHVSALFIDETTRKVRFLQVGVGGFLGLGEQAFLVPIEDVTRTEPAEIHIHHSRGHVFGAPLFNPALTTPRPHGFWDPYYGHYGHDPDWGAGD